MRLRAVFATVALVGALVAASPTGAVRGVALGPGGALTDLAVLRSGRPRHASSADPTGGNADFRLLPSGATLTLFEAKGAGVARRFWLTFLPRNSPPLAFDPQVVVAAHRQTILRMYWDGERLPSVEVPLGDFFGVGFGEQRDYVSLPLSETSGGYTCYWPMPFHRAARWTVTNLGPSALILYWNIDWTSYDTLPARVAHFHAQWRRENPTTPGQSYTILEARGRGHYVGAAVFMRNGASVPIATFGFLEGDERIYVDDERTPSIVGTGTEDYFSGGFYFDRGTYAAPYHGVTIWEAMPPRIAAYRWHVEDAMSFVRSIRVTLEHGTQNTVEGDYSSVAYFYQREPHAAFPPLPPPAALLP